MFLMSIFVFGQLHIPEAPPDVVSIIFHRIFIRWSRYHSGCAEKDEQFVSKLTTMRLVGRKNAMA